MSRPRSNLHCHSRYSDGAHTLEEMVQAAIQKGFASLGFSEHAWNPYDGDCCITQANTPLYLEEIRRLKEAYRGKIQLYAGLEVDALSPNPKEGLDFTVGSVHYLRDEEGACHCIDHLPEMLEAARDKVAGGDIRRLVDLYYETLLRFVADYRPDVTAHLDLICKLNRDGRYFDEKSRWYRNLMGQTAEALAAMGAVVEVNTGGICRGYREEPYPSREFLGLLRELEIPVVIASDAHTAQDLDFWFLQAEELLKQLGYRYTLHLLDGSLSPVEL